jgi:hypothetical protein
MNLTRVDDATQNQWIVNTGNMVMPGGGVTAFMWSGGTEGTTRGSWLWPDGTLFYQSGPVGGLYSNWGNGEPKSGGGNPYCVGLLYDFTWAGLPCTETHNFCCQQ